MVDLPDLDTTSVSYIAYWNAIDQGGASSIDAEDAVSDGSLNSVTTYDNGFTGSYSLNSGRNATVRVKNDGWIVAYLDRTENYTLKAENRQNTYGPWDLAPNWTAPAGRSNPPVPELTQNDLSNAINSLRSNLSASTSFSHQNVPLYNYQHQGASSTILGVREGRNGTFSYTNINLLWAAAFGSADDSDPDSYFSASFNGITLCEGGSGVSTWTDVGTYDSEQDLSADTEFDVSSNTGNNSNAAASYHLAIWDAA